MVEAGPDTEPSQADEAELLSSVEPEQPDGEVPRRSSPGAQGDEIQLGKVTEGQIRQWFHWIDVDALNGDVLRQVGVALHHHFDGSRSGWRLWHDFCRRSANYERAAREQEHRGFGSAAQERS